RGERLVGGGVDHAGHDVPLARGPGGRVDPLGQRPVALDLDGVDGPDRAAGRGVGGRAGAVEGNDGIHGADLQAGEAVGTAAVVDGGAVTGGRQGVLGAR